MEEWRANQESESKNLAELTTEFRHIIGSNIENFDLAKSSAKALPHITSLSFLYVQGEELLRELERAGFSVDSGSACTDEDLQPSHVLSAMGLLTHGNIRVTFHPGTTREQIKKLARGSHRCSS
ncbi:MAG: aminotransferase class V-fold PLP-dependent enzyme [Actinomycetota bacterium]